MLHHHVTLSVVIMWMLPHVQRMIPCLGGSCLARRLLVLPVGGLGDSLQCRDEEGPASFWLRNGR